MRFDANVTGGLPWRFEPEQTSVNVAPGAQTKIFYRSQNLSARAITAQSLGMTNMIHAPTVPDSVIPNINIGGFTGPLFGSGSFSWSPYNRWMRPVIAATDWIIQPIRRVLPPLGMIDMSPMVAWLILYVVRGLLVSWV